MLQRLAEKTCKQKNCDRSANALEVAPDCACTHPLVLSRRYPALHEEISESPSQMHIQQQHAHLHRTDVFEPTSCTSRQCISFGRCRRPFEIGKLESDKGGKTRHGLVAPIQDSPVLTFVRRSYSNHDHERSTFLPWTRHEIFV